MKLNKLAGVIGFTAATLFSVSALAAGVDKDLPDYGLDFLDRLAQIAAVDGHVAPADGAVALILDTAHLVSYGQVQEQQLAQQLGRAA